MWDEHPNIPLFERVGKARRQLYCPLNNLYKLYDSLKLYKKKSRKKSSNKELRVHEFVLNIEYIICKRNQPIFRTKQKIM